MFRTVRLAEAIVFAFLTCLSVVGPAVAEDWSQYRGDARWSGYYDATIDPARFRPLWEQDRAAQNSLQDVVMDRGQVYWINQIGWNGRNNVASISAAGLTDGLAGWETEFDVRSVNSVEAPTLAGGRVYVARGGHSFLAAPQPWDAPRLLGFNLATGQREMHRLQGGQGLHTDRPVALGNDLIVPGGLYGGMYGYRADTATPQWFNDLGNDGYANATPQIYGEYLISSPLGAELQRMHRANGQVADPLTLLDEGTIGYGGQQRAITTDGDLVGSFVLSNTADHDYGLASFDLDTGVMNWQFGFDNQFSRSVAVGHGRAAVTQGTKLHVLDGQTGQAEFEWTAPGGYNTSEVLLTRSHAIVQTQIGYDGYGRIHAVNLDTGQSEWMVDAKGSLAANNGVLVVAGNTEISTFRIAPPDPLTVSPSIDVAAAFNGSGFDLTDGNDSILTQKLDFANIDRRAILEFDLRENEDGFAISRAVLELDPSVYTFNENDFPQISIYGYLGNGVAEQADATQTAQLLAVSDPIASLDPFQIELDPASIDQLLADSDWLGLVVVGSEDGKQLGFVTTESSFGIAPSLTLDYTWLDLAGDYNLNGEIDAADYTVWQDNFGSTTNLAADGNGNGIIDAADYTVWQDNFGATSAAAFGLTNIPEPGTLALLSLGFPALMRRRAAAR